MQFSKRIGGAISTLALVVAGVAIIDLNPAILTRPTASAGGIWVPVDLTGEVVRVDAATGRVTARVDVADRGSRLRVGETGPRLVVVDEHTGDVVSVDRALHRVDRRVRTGLRDAAFVDFAAQGIAIGNGTEIVRVGPDVDRAVPMAATDTHRSLTVSDRGAVVATADRVVAVGPTASTALATGVQRPVLVRMGAEVLWSDGDELRDLAGARRGCLGATPRPDAQWAAHPSGLVAAVDAQSGVVEFIDTITGTCNRVRVVAPGTRLGRPAVALGVIFVPEPAAGLVHIVDPTAPTDLILDAVTAGSARLDVHVADDVVIVHDPLSSIGAVLDAGGVVRSIDTSSDAVPPERDEVALSAVEATPSPELPEPQDREVALVQIDPDAEIEEPVVAPGSTQSTGGAPTVAPRRAAVAKVQPPSVLTASVTTTTTPPPTFTTLPTTSTTTTTTTTSTTTTSTTTTTTSTTLPPTTTTVDDDDNDGDDHDDKPEKGREKAPRRKLPKGKDD